MRPVRAECDLDPEGAGPVACEAANGSGRRTVGVDEADAVVAACHRQTRAVWILHKCNSVMSIQRICTFPEAFPKRTSMFPERSLRSEVTRVIP
jgi:hypothetical protein